MSPEDRGGPLNPEVSSTVHPCGKGFLTWGGRGTCVEHVNCDMYLLKDMLSIRCIHCPLDSWIHGSTCDCHKVHDISVHISTKQSPFDIMNG